MGMLAFEAKDAMTCSGFESLTCEGIRSFSTRDLVTLGEQCSSVCAPARSLHDSSFGRRPCRDALLRTGRGECHHGSNLSRSRFVQSISFSPLRGLKLSGFVFALASRPGQHLASGRKVLRSDIRWATSRCALPAESGLTWIKCQLERLYPLAPARSRQRLEQGTDEPEKV